MKHIQDFESFSIVPVNEAYDSNDKAQVSAWDAIQGFVRSYMKDNLLDKKTASDILKGIADEINTGG